MIPTIMVNKSCSCGYEHGVNTLLDVSPMCEYGTCIIETQPLSGCGRKMDRGSAGVDKEKTSPAAAAAVTKTQHGLTQRPAQVDTWSTKHLSSTVHPTGCFVISRSTANCCKGNLGGLRQRQSNVCFIEIYTSVVGDHSKLIRFD